MDTHIGDLHPSIVGKIVCSLTDVPYDFPYPQTEKSR